VKVAVTLAAAFMVTTQLPPPLQAPPQLVNFQPRAGAGVSVTKVPLTKLALQVAPQLMPAGELVTVPSPLSLTLSVKSCLNVAVTDCAEFIVTKQVPLPVQAPLQLLKTQPAAAAGVKVTWVPAVKRPLHVPGQSMPEGLLVTVPLPLTVTVSTVSEARAVAALHGADALPELLSVNTTAGIPPVERWEGCQS
jgi:hypothetical protein